MYFLRRRHGRKQQPDTRRDAAPAQVASHPPSNLQAQPEPPPPYLEDEHPEPIKPVVITKAKRPRVTAAAVPEEDDCKPGTFRSGTLHIAHGSRTEVQHGKA